MTAEIFEVIDDGSGNSIAGPPLTLLGEFLGWDANDEAIWGPLNITFLSDATVDLKPLAPSLFGVLTSRTASSLFWEPVDPRPGEPPLQEWVVERRQSSNDGATFGAWAEVTGTSEGDSPFAPSVIAFTQSSLPTDTTPEMLFEYRVAGVNSDGQGEWSNALPLQWESTPVAQPTACTAFTLGELTNTSAAFTWNETNDPSVFKHGLWRGNTLVVDNITAGARSFVWTGLTPGSQHNAMNIRRANLAADGTTVQWSPTSNQINVSVPELPPFEVELLVGCSASDNDHGSLVVDQPDNNWDGWRVYGLPEATTIANRTGINRPIFLCVSHDGPNMGGSNPNYNTVFNQILAELNDFYYTTPTGQTHTARWGIRYYRSNGNENHDKGALSGNSGPGSLSAAQIAAFVTSQRAVYDAVHYIDPTTGQRRFPDAYAGSNPVHEAELDGMLAQYLQPSARYHDFVVWSSYPPGRQSSNDDPTYNWPSMNVADRTNRQLGYQIRCFYRTDQMRQQARIDTGNPNLEMEIAVGEWGIGDDPGDTTTRPYFAVHGMYYGWYRLAQQFRIASPFAIWWDQQKKLTGGGWDTSAPENLLSTGRDGNGVLARHEPTNTSPSTADAIRAWRSYCHPLGGTHPASWDGNPKPSGSGTGGTWKRTGPVV